MFCQIVGGPLKLFYFNLKGFNQKFLFEWFDTWGRGTSYQTTCFLSLFHPLSFFLKKDILYYLSIKTAFVTNYFCHHTFVQNRHCGRESWLFRFYKDLLKGRNRFEIGQTWNSTRKEIRKSERYRVCCQTSKTFSFS